MNKNLICLILLLGVLFLMKKEKKIENMTDSEEIPDSLILWYPLVDVTQDGKVKSIGQSDLELTVGSDVTINEFGAQFYRNAFGNDYDSTEENHNQFLPTPMCAASLASFTASLTSFASMW